MSTPNLAFTENTGVNFEIEANTTFQEINDFLSEDTTLLVTSSNSYTVSSTEIRRNYTFKIDEDGVDPADSSITVTFPAIKRGTFYAVNNTAFTVTLTISGQSETPPTLAAGESAEFNTDGSDIRKP